MLTKDCVLFVCLNVHQAAAKAQNITGINAYRADVIAALSEIMLNLTATTATNSTAMPTAAKV